MLLKEKLVVCSHLLNLSDPTADVLLKGVQEGRVTEVAAEFLGARLASGISGFLDHTLNGLVDGEGDLWNINVLLKMEETDFKFIDLLLHRRHQFVSVTAWQSRVMTQHTCTRLVHVPATCTCMYTKLIHTTINDKFTIYCYSHKLLNSCTCTHV